MKELDLFDFDEPTTEHPSASGNSDPPLVPPVKEKPICQHCGRLLGQGRGSPCPEPACYTVLCDACLAKHPHLELW
jgi:hypothetical protein